MFFRKEYDYTDIIFHLKNEYINLKNQENISISLSPISSLKNYNKEEEKKQFILIYNKGYTNFEYVNYNYTTLLPYEKNSLKIKVNYNINYKIFSFNNKIINNEIKGNIVFNFSKKNKAYLYSYKNSKDIYLENLNYFSEEAGKYIEKIDLKNDTLFTFNYSLNLTYYFVLFSYEFNDINDNFYVYNPSIPYLLNINQKYDFSYQTDLINDSFLFYVNNKNNFNSIYFHYQWFNLYSNLSIKIFNSTYEKEDINKFIKKNGFIKIEKNCEY